jgi:hypothetical protein
MINHFYICSKEEENYADTFRSLDCVEGDRTKLIKEVEGEQDFCKGQNKSAIDYDFFLKSITENTVLYIKSEIGNVLGCCSISINFPENISISVICVPDRGVKGIGTSLIDKLKEFAKSLSVPSIGAVLDPSVQTFYLKNGFKIINDHDDDDDFMNGSGYISMRYTLPKGRKKKKAKTKAKKSKKAKKAKKANHSKKANKKK